MHLLAVGAVFISGYQLTLRRAAKASSREILLDTSVAADAWIPFLDFSILIYLSINVLYIAVFYLCRYQQELDRKSVV